MKLLFLYRGHNSGTNEAVLHAWQRQLPSGDVTAIDLDRSVSAGAGAMLLELPTAIRRGGLAALWPGRGCWHDAVKRSDVYMRRLAQQVAAATAVHPGDAVLAMGSAWPMDDVDRPYFLYSDMVILANRLYPGGERYLDLWREVLPWERRALDGAAAVFTMSEHISTVLREDYGLPADRIVRVNGGCNIPLATYTNVAAKTGRSVLFLGVDWQRKGGPETLDAFRRIRAKHPDVVLTIAGCSPNVNEPGVQVLGRVSPHRAAELLAEADVMCLPSRREPFGIVYLEAMRTGTPVIAADQGATPDFVRNGETGFRVPAGDVDAIAERLDELLASPALRAHMGRRGRELVAAEYTWEETIRRMQDHMQRTLGVARRQEAVAI